MTFNNTAPVPSTQLAFNCNTNVCYEIENDENSAQEINANKVEFSKMLFTTKCSANSLLRVYYPGIKGFKCSYTIYDRLLRFQMSPRTFKASTALIGSEFAWLVCVAGRNLVIENVAETET